MMILLVTNSLRCTSSFSHLTKYENVSIFSYFHKLLCYTQMMTFFCLLHHSWAEQDKGPAVLELWSRLQTGRQQASCWLLLGTKTWTATTWPPLAYITRHNISCKNLQPFQCEYTKRYTIHTYKTSNLSRMSLRAKMIKITANTPHSRHKSSLDIFQLSASRVK